MLMGMFPNPIRKKYPESMPREKWSFRLFPTTDSMSFGESSRRKSVFFFVTKFQYFDGKIMIYLSTMPTERPGLRHLKLSVKVGFLVSGVKEGAV